MSKENLKGIEGFSSVYPEDWAKWRYVRDIVESTLESFGFQGISTPSVERRSLYEVKPPWSEGLIDQTFSITDLQGNQLTLIPEQTPTRARMIQELDDPKLPIRWFDTSKRWRQETKIKKDRKREFWQTDADIIGSDSIEADAEILACVAKIYENLGLSNDIEISINDRKLLENILFSAGVEKKDAYTAVKIVDDREKITDKEFLTRFKELGLSDGQASSIYQTTSLNGPIRKCIKDLTNKDEALAQKSKKQLDRLLHLATLLEHQGIYNICKLDLSIARGSFYTGIILEVTDKDKQLGALTGGGRYDWLVGVYGGKDLPAIGFGFGYSGTMTKLEEKRFFDQLETKPKIVISYENSEKNYPLAVKLANSLRENGQVVEMDIDKNNHENYEAEIHILLKKDFYEDSLAEITAGGKKTTKTIEGINSLLRQLKL